MPSYGFVRALYAVSAVIAIPSAASVPSSSRTVTFAVVGFGEKAEVSVGGTTFPLSAPWPADPYFNGTVNLPTNVKSYKYVIDGKPEPFNRPLDERLKNTLNEFYGREITYQAMPQFRSPFVGEEDAEWNRGSRAEIFDGGYIPTVHFSGEEVESYITTAADATVDVLFVGPTQAMKYQGVSASAKNDEFAKAQLKVEFPGEVFYGRSTIKMRNSETDATLMREQLYTEMLRSTGAPTQETNKVRVYYNKKEYGLLELQDKVADESFIAQLFYGNGRRPETLGVPLDCSTGADFSPNGPYDAFQQTSGRPEGNERVVALSRALSQLDVSNAAAIAEFEKSWFDINSFFKAIAMEYLSGHWDSYWYFTTNFAVYDNPLESANGKFKFYFIDQDFDQTFGIAFGSPYNTAGLKGTSRSYKELLSRKWKLDELDAPDRTMVNKLLKGPSILTPRFEKILTGIVKHMFNPDIINSKLDALIKRYRPEIEWDRQIKRPHEGINQWTIEDFDAGLEGPVGTNEWGLRQWVQERATAVAKEFNFEWDTAPLPVVSTLTALKNDVTDYNSAVRTSEATDYNSAVRTSEATDYNSAVTTSDGSTSDDETGDDEISDDEISDDETSDDQISDDEDNEDEDNDDEDNDDETSDDETNDDETNYDETNYDETNDDETYDDETNDDETNDDETYDDETNGDDNWTSDDATSGNATSDGSTTAYTAAVDTTNGNTTNPAVSRSRKFARPLNDLANGGSTVRPAGVLLIAAAGVSSFMRY